MPDILLTYTFNIVPAVGGAVLTASVASTPAVTSAVDYNFALTIGVAASTCHVVNVTDIATGAVTQVVGGRRLGGAPGSQGVAFTVVANLGKTPTQTSTQAMLTKLASLDPAVAPLFSTVIAAVAVAANRPSSSFLAATPVAPTVANAPFAVAAPASVAADSGSSTSVGGAAGGAVGAVAALLLLAYCVSSYRTHGALPCFRDFKKERKEEQERKRREAEAAEIQRELLQAVSAATSNPAARLGSGASAGSAVRQLLEQREKQDRDNAQLRALLAEQAQRSAAIEGASLELRVAVPAKRKDFAPAAV